MSGPTYYESNGVFLTCVQLATDGLCSHEEYGCDISSKCPLSCNSCGTCDAADDATGFSFGSSHASCAQLAPYCSDGYSLSSLDDPLASPSHARQPAPPRQPCDPSIESVLSQDVRPADPGRVPRDVQLRLLRAAAAAQPARRAGLPTPRVEPLKWWLVKLVTCDL